MQGLPPDQFGSGSAVGQALRNLGSTFGVALVIAFTTGATGVEVLDGFHHVWWVLVGSGLVVSLLATRLVHHRSVMEATAPVQVSVAD